MRAEQEGDKRRGIEGDKRGGVERLLVVVASQDHLLHNPRLLHNSA